MQEQQCRHGPIFTLCMSRPIISTDSVFSHLHGVGASDVEGRTDAAMLGIRVIAIQAAHARRCTNLNNEVLPPVVDQRNQVVIEQDGSERLAASSASLPWPSAVHFCRNVNGLAPCTLFSASLRHLTQSDVLNELASVNRIEIGTENLHAQRSCMQRAAVSASK